MKARTDWILGETLLLEADKLCWWPRGTRWRRRKRMLKRMLMCSNVWCYWRLREIASALHLKYFLSLDPTVCFTVSMSRQHHIWLPTVVTIQKERLINVSKGVKTVIAVTRSILRAYTHTHTHTQNTQNYWLTPFIINVWATLNSLLEATLPSSSALFKPFIHTVKLCQCPSSILQHNSNQVL